MSHNSGKALVESFTCPIIRLPIRTAGSVRCGWDVCHDVSRASRIGRRRRWGEWGVPSREGLVRRGVGSGDHLGRV